MEETLQNKIIAELKKDAQDHPDLVSMDDEALQQFMAGLLEQKTRWAKTNDPEMCNALLALNYKEKRLICNAAFSAVRRLGVLGQIIADPDITEVMINGYKTIFVEKAGKLKKLDLQFENAQELETIITKFVSQAGRAVNESEPIVQGRMRRLYMTIAQKRSIRRDQMSKATYYKKIRVYGWMSVQISIVLVLRCIICSREDVRRKMQKK